VKENEAKVETDRHQVLLYVEKADGTIGPMQTGAYMVANYMDDFVAKRKNLEAECMEKLRSGAVSPVGYFLMLNNITAADVAARVGISVSKVNKHAAPEGFSKVTIDLAQKYAGVFGVPLARLFEVIICKDAGLAATYGKTQNPAVSIVEISRSN
jgi:hypothetical protein